MNKRREPDVQKATQYAIVINSIQILALLLFVLYVTLADFNNQNRIYLQLIAVVGALMAGWGASVDIREALHTRRRVRWIEELQATNEQMNQLNLALRAQRHDFVSHLQVVYSLLEMEEYHEATDYLEQVYNSIQSVSSILRTRMTAFNALIQVKSAVCKEQGIDLTLDIRTALADVGMPPWELCCVIGNLLDNAMDATQGTAKRSITLEITESLRGFTFTVSNNGNPIPKPLHEAIFEAGVTTKGDGHGMGLSIVRQTLAEYHGEIVLEKSDDLTVFVVSVPHETKIITPDMSTKEEGHNHDGNE